MEWINVKDKLPPTKDNDVGISVLTYSPDWHCKVAVYSPDAKCWHDADDVTHWMELPELPKE